MPSQSEKKNLQKAHNYTEYFKLYNCAKKAGFYLECLWILYALIEDRTSAFLYYLGFTSETDHTKVTGTKYIKRLMRQIFHMEESKGQYGFRTLSGKLKRIRQVLSWSNIEADTDLRYEIALQKAVQPLVSNESFNTALDYLDGDWRNTRNKLTHALFSKNYEESQNELLPLVEQGYTAMREMDDAVKKIKKARLRQKFKIQ